jgi:hypothetical protein
MASIKVAPKIDRVVARIAERMDTLPTRPLITRRYSTVLVVLLFTLTILTPLQVRPTIAQPFCVGETIWDAEAGACVELASPTPSVPAPSPTSTVPEEPDAVATEDDGSSSDEGQDDDGSEDETSEDISGNPTATMLPDETGDPRQKSHGYPMALSLFTFECPWNLDIANVSQVVRRDTCGEFLGGATYSLDIDGFGYGPAISPNGTGGTGWSELDPGLATILITPPANFTNPPAVYCWTSKLVADPPIETSYTGINGLGGFQLQLAPDDIWYCSAYFRAAAAGSITLDVRRCPDGMDIYNTTPSMLADTCLASASGLEFMLFHDRAGVSIAYTSPTSKAIFYRIEPGTGRIRMSPPPGTGLPVVYCETVGPQGQTFSQYDWVYTAIDASFDVEFANDQTTFCDVFIVTGGIDVEIASQPDWAEGLPVASPPASGCRIEDDEIDNGCD